MAEGAVAIKAGLIAGLISVIGFGVDSAIESMSAVLVTLRLSARLRHGVADERKERIALKLVAVSFSSWLVTSPSRAFAARYRGSARILTSRAHVARGITDRDADSGGGQEACRGRAARQPHPGRRRRNQNLCPAEHLHPAWACSQLTGAAWLDPAAGFVIAAFAAAGPHARLRLTALGRY